MYRRWIELDERPVALPVNLFVLGIEIGDPDKRIAHHDMVVLV
jgi:hypothetical protein